MPPRMLIISLCIAFVVAIASAAPDETTYRLGPQDEITVTVLRHPELSQSLTVPPDGIIDFPRAGRITVTGKTTAEVTAALKEKYGEFLVAPDVTVVVAKARIKSAFVVGAVGKPGQYTITDTTRVAELLAAAGDLVGERQELTANLKRGNTVIPLDLQTALSSENPEANLLVQEGDVLWVVAPPRITVTVLGQVKNPGPVKLRENSTLVDALAAAGDVVDRPERMRISLKRRAATKNLTWGDTTEILKDGDVIQVEKEPQARIFVNGHVKNPGAYDLPEGGGVLEAIALAGGVLDSPALSQVTIIRAKDGSHEPIDLSKTLGEIPDKVAVVNIKLAAGDQVIVPQSNARISVWGYVEQAGNFRISESSPITVIDAIAMAGGATKRARLSKVGIIRITNGKTERIEVDVNAVMKKGQYEKNITLQPGDVVFVPETDHPDWGGILENLSRVGILAAAL